MEKIKIFCFGFGQVAESFINKLINEKKIFDLNITSRQETHKITLNNLEITSFLFNEEKSDKSLISKLEEANYILVSIPPINGDDIVVKYLKKNFKQNKNCKWITYLSATSVYGDYKGDWVTEKSITKPKSSNGLHRLNAENSWRDTSIKNNLPLQIFRLAGIYSDKYNILKRLKKGDARIVNKKDHFFSRVHVEDIANILFKSLETFKNGETFNICDDKPASQKEVASYGAKLLKLDQPKSINLEDLESEMMKNFYKESKKVDNKKMKIFFNYKLKYPTYVEGLNKIFNNSF